MSDGRTERPEPQQPADDRGAEPRIFELALAPEPDAPALPPEPHADIGAPAGGAVRGPSGNGPLGLRPPEPAEPAEPTGPVDFPRRSIEPPPFWVERPAPQERRFPLGAAVLAWLIAVLLGAGAGAAATFYALRDEPVASGGAVRVSPPIPDAPDEPANAAAAVAEAVLPSIVRIDVSGGLGFGGVGSGVVYRPDGYIVTNDHVVRDAQQIEVRLADGSRLDAAVVGSAAPAVDIAVIKVVEDDLPAATFGTTDDLKVGDLAVAIGSPFGLEATVTAGVISAVHRNRIQGADVGVPDAIQTDAAINPGNSGGALADANGEVIGINTAIIGESGGNVGIGFAIPVEIVRKVTDQIIQSGEARLAFLGVQGNTIPGGGGALIVQVVPGGPADEAGIRPDDVIVEIDGRPIATFEELVSYLIAKDVGDRVEIGYLRDDARADTTATLAERPEG